MFFYERKLICVQNCQYFERSQKAKPRRTVVAAGGAARLRYVAASVKFCHALGFFAGSDVMQLKKPHLSIYMDEMGVHVHVGIE